MHLQQLHVRHVDDVSWMQRLGVALEESPIHLSDASRKMLPSLASSLLVLRFVDCIWCPVLVRSIRMLCSYGCYLSNMHVFYALRKLQLKMIFQRGFETRAALIDALTWRLR